MQELKECNYGIMVKADWIMASATGQDQNREPGNGHGLDIISLGWQLGTSPENTLLLPHGLSIVLKVKEMLHRHTHLCILHKLMDFNNTRRCLIHIGNSNSVFNTTAHLHLVSPVGAEQQIMLTVQLLFPWVNRLIHYKRDQIKSNEIQEIK